MAPPRMAGTPRAPQTEALAGLRFRRHFQLHAPIQRRHFYFAAKGGVGEGEGHVAVEVATVASEDRVLGDAELHIEIARRRAPRAGLPFARHAQAVAVIHSGRHRDGQRLATLHAAATAAGRARVADDAAGATAARTRLLEREKALGDADLATPAALRTIDGLGAGLGPAAIAALAGRQVGHGNLHRVAAHGLLQRELHGVLQIRAGSGAAAAARPSPEDVAKDLAEDVADVAEAGGVEPRSARRAVHASVAEAIVTLPLLGVRQHGVGFRGFLELLLRVRVAGVAIRVVFHGEPAVRFFHVRFRSAAVNAKDVVIVAFRHISRLSRPGSRRHAP